MVLQDLGDLVGAKTQIERALVIDEMVYSSAHPNVATDSSNLGSVLHDLGDLTGARMHIERGLAIDEAVYGPEDPEVATDASNLGSVLRDLGDLVGAKALFERALAIWVKFLPADHADIHNARVDLAFVESQLRDQSI
jgi:tetratricopeptide (TPR) repeat protein